LEADDARPDRRAPVRGMTPKPQGMTMTYHDLVARYGKDMAFDLLVTIEKMAKIEHDIAAASDEETRLQHALDMLDKMDATA
jgi:hypothetical protein